MPDASGSVTRRPIELGQWFRDGDRLKRILLEGGLYFQESKTAPKRVLVRRKRRRFDGKPGNGV